MPQITLSNSEIVESDWISNADYFAKGAKNEYGFTVDLPGAVFEQPTIIIKLKSGGVIRLEGEGADSDRSQILAQDVRVYSHPSTRSF